jgi:hypothetical protein
MGVTAVDTGTGADAAPEGTTGTEGSTGALPVEGGVTGGETGGVAGDLAPGQPQLHWHCIGWVCSCACLQGFLFLPPTLTIL